MVFFHVKSWHIVGFRVGQLHPFFWWIWTADVQRSNAVHFHWFYPGNGSPKNYESWVNPLDLWGKCCTGKRKHDAGEDEAGWLLCWDGVASQKVGTKQYFSLSIKKTHDWSFTQLCIIYSEENWHDFTYIAETIYTTKQPCNTQKPRDGPSLMWKK